ncbi:MAG: ATP-binding cassette domain-containing protein [Candidatus Cloacimonetes bacterium]|nr:ATP-binding cassette domain-containing protein [Candidatus Cloacimonadota bacterium]
MIEFRNLSLKVKNRVLFDNYNLKIKKGEKIVITSISGKGKTTLFRLLLGFQQPDSGEILIDGKQLNPKSLIELRSFFSYVSQDVDLQKITLDELLDVIFSYDVNKDLERNDKKLFELLERFNLNEEYLEKIIPELSGGERQRIGLIICCLLQRPIWLLDEPTSALDQEMKKLVVDHVMSSNSTALIISHEKMWLEAQNIREVKW